MKIICRGALDDDDFKGSTCEDVGTVVCCGHLANCQLAQEIQERGDKQCKIISSIDHLIVSL